LDLSPTPRLTMSLEPQVSLTGLRCYAPDGGDGDGDGGDCGGEVQSTRGERRRIDEGLRATFKLGPSVAYDGRDNPFTPTRGIYASAEAVYAIGSTLPKEALRSSVDERFRAEAWQPFYFTKLEGQLSGYLRTP